MNLSLNMFPINTHIKKIESLCKLHNVDKLYVFGSATNNDFNDFSDIDFLVKFKPFDLKKY